MRCLLLIVGLMCPHKYSRHDSSHFEFSDSEMKSPDITLLHGFHSASVSGRNNNVPTEGTPVIQTIKTYFGSKTDPLTERELPCECDSSLTSAVAVFLSPASLPCFSVSDDHVRLFRIQLLVPQPTSNICTMSHSRWE